MGGPVQADPLYVVMMLTDDDWHEVAETATKPEAIAIVKAMADDEIAVVHDSVGRVGASKGWFGWFMEQVEAMVDEAVAERAAVTHG